MSEHFGYRDGSGEPPGPLADEAARLVGAAQDWWHRTVGAGSAGASGAGGAGIATGSPECCWCPVCQAIATVRGERPDILQRLAETQTALSGLLRALADPTANGRASRPEDQRPADHSPADQSPSEGHSPSADQSPSEGHSPQDGPRASRVQKIQLDSDPSTDGSGQSSATSAASTSATSAASSPHPTASNAADPGQDLT